MPELPEVETVVRELRPLLTGRVIEKIEPLWAKTLENRSAIKPEGQKIIQLSRVGKFIFLEMERSWLAVHLRMTGRLAWKADGESDTVGKHVRLIVRFKDGSVLLFEDTRKFGRVYHIDRRKDVLQNVGIDALDERLNARKFFELLKTRKMGIKAFLLSQKWIAGLGNIYVDESLFKAGIHPLRPCAKLSFAEAERLFAAVREVLQNAVKNMGSTISDYRDAYGNPGRNQRYFKVYRRAGEPCFECGTPIKKQRIAGRGTHFCPTCQK